MSRDIPAPIARRWTMPNLLPGVHGSHHWGPARLFDTEGMDHLIRVTPKYLLLLCDLGNGWVFTLYEHKRWFREKLRPGRLSSKLGDASDPLWEFITASTSLKGRLDLEIYTFARSKQGMKSSQGVAERIVEGLSSSYEAWRKEQPNADDLPIGVMGQTIPIDGNREPCESVLHLDANGGIELVSDAKMEKVKKKAKARALP